MPPGSRQSVKKAYARWRPKSNRRTLPVYGGADRLRYALDRRKSTRIAAVAAKLAARPGLRARRIGQTRLLVVGRSLRRRAVGAALVLVLRRHHGLLRLHALGALVLLHAAARLADRALVGIDLAP